MMLAAVTRAPGHGQCQCLPVEKAVVPASQFCGIGADVMEEV